MTHEDLWFKRRDAELIERLRTEIVRRFAWNYTVYWVVGAPIYYLA
jgi:hypothetical protein